MKRREFVAGLAGTASLPLVARAEDDRVRRIGRLTYTSESDPISKHGVAAFIHQLELLGWKPSAFRLEYRYGEGDYLRTAASAKELVALGPDVMLVRGTPATRAVLQETRTIPIVFVSVSDPVGDGFVNSVVRPGGNLTGFTNLDAMMGGKWLELLKEVAPNIKRVGAFFNPDVATAGGTFYVRAIAEAAPSFAVTLEKMEVRTPRDIERGIEALTREADVGLIGMPDPFVVAYRTLTMDLAARYRVPAVYGFRNMAVEGGLMSYGVDLVDLDRRSAVYVDRILKGARPGELPIQAPNKFELVVNLKTAKTLGLTIPPSLLARADEVIE